jgi:hypothetical protein
MNFFNIDAHISVIADIKNIFNSLGHNVDTLSISGHSWVFNKEQSIPKIINSSNWQNIDEKMCDDFYEQYKNTLDKYDGFICGYPPAFAQLYEKFNKPIFVIAATRYEYPYTFDKKKWEKFNKYLIENKNITKISNNLFDKYYCELFTEAEWKYIPSLCEYTNAKYNKQSDNIILFSKTKKIDKLVNKDFLGRYTWQELYSNKAIVHIPYNYSTMSIFEQYTANVPLIFPDKKYLLELFLKNECMSEISFRQVFKKNPDSILETFEDPNVFNNLNTFIKNLDYSDFYSKEWMPHIEYFSSEEDLKYKINNLNFDEISINMSIKNLERKEKIYNLWKEIL